MRHLKKNKKLGRSPSHRSALLAALVCGLIREKRIKTTLPKARLARRSAEKMVTLAKQGTLAARRLAIARLHREDCVAELFKNVAPQFADRKGGYTRIIKLSRRRSDGSDMALLEWVGIAVPDKTKKEEPKKDETKKS